MPEKNKTEKTGLPTLADHQKEVDANAVAFVKMLPGLLDQGHEGKYALMRACEVEEILETFDDAFRVGKRLFQNHPFSVQEISDVPENLGAYSYGV